LQHASDGSAGSASRAGPGSVQLAAIDAVGAGYRHVFLSPHFDDVALSASGVALLQRRRREPVLVVAAFTAPPVGALTEFAQFQHGRWGSAADPWRQREEEERSAMAALGADYLWLGYADAIYRGDQYLSDADLFGPVKPGDADLRRNLGRDIVRIWRRCPGATVYLPLGVGGHVDHRLCGDAAADLRLAGAAVAWYEDFPYVLEPGAVDRRIEALGVAPSPLVVDVEPALEDKIRLVELYRSQVPWIFRSYGEPGAAIRRRAASLSPVPGGYAERLWLDRRGAS